MRARDRYRHVTRRDVEAMEEADRVQEEQQRQSDAEAAEQARPEAGEWAVYDLIHGAAYYEDGDPRKQ